MEHSSSSSTSSYTNTPTTITPRRARTPSVSATAAIVHGPQQQQPQQKNSSSSSFHMHTWATERAKIAAESEISPPISPKQHAAVDGPQGHDYLEPLQEANNNDRHEHANNSNPNTNNSSTDDEDGAINHHRSNSNNAYSHSHSHFQHQQSGSISHYKNNNNNNSINDNNTLEPMSSGLLLTRSDSPSLISGSSSASSSSTCISSHSSATSRSSLHTLQKLDIEHKQPGELFLIDTPPSSHVASPSSPPFPAMKEPLPLYSANDISPIDAAVTTTATTTTTSAVRTKTRAPYHCTKKSVGQIIREISDLVDGRDKAIKVVQYFAKVILWVFLSDPRQYKILATRLKALAKQFSTTRKVLRLTHFIDPLATVLTLGATFRVNLHKHGLRGTLTKSPSMTWKDTMRDRLGSLNTMIGLVQDISDDIYCLGVIGVLDRSFADKAEPWSNRLWMVGVTIDLHENFQSIRDVKKQIRALESKRVAEGFKSREEEEAWNAQHVKLTTKLHWLKVTTVKLGGDFLFCAYDNLHCSFSDGFQAVTGFASGVAGAYKFVGKVMES
ncbi:hypothetical protein BGZ46_002575 [Entomortierella lignicola]|nr:hypothetical protein BGZ46_002575 [Entomortierella lignicola]